MATPFFTKEWERLTAEELATARARLAGFIEAVPDKERILREQLEATQKALQPVQDGIMSFVKLFAKLPAEPAELKTEAAGALAELRKADEAMRDRLFVLQVWRKYDQETADKMARRKAGEFLDPELAKVLEEREKRLDRDRREQEKAKDRSSSRPAKRFRGGMPHYGNFVPVPLEAGPSYQVAGRSGYGQGYGQGYGNQGYGNQGGPAKGGKKPGPDNKCHLCKQPGHFFRSCPTYVKKDWEDSEESGTGHDVTSGAKQGNEPTEQTSTAQEGSRDGTLQTEFFPGSIHTEKVRDFWRAELKAGDWVMDVLKEGYVIPFKEHPPLYEERNNASAVENMDFVREAVMDLKRLGTVEFRDERPHCVSPLTVTKKVSADGSIKKRLCWDGSRCVNLYIKEQKVTLSHLQRALEITREQDYQVVYDLKAAYHHIRIHPAQTKYLGAAIVTPDGATQYFVFLFLPFGLSSAVHCITKLFKPINAFIHEKGIRHTIYLDDGRIVAENAGKAEEHRVIVYDVLEKTGWIRELKKSDGQGDASQVKEYLGFILDTKSMTVRLEETKKQHILQRVGETISYGPKPIHAKELAGTLGKIVATEPALGPVVVMAARASYTDLDRATQEKGWGTRLVMSKESLDGLKFFVENCSDFDNTPIRTVATEISVLSIIGPPSSFMKSSFVANHVRTDREKIWASDASGYATCAYSIKGENLYFRGMLSEDERSLSSGHRELLAVTRTLEYYERTGTIDSKATNVYWLTDSQNVASFLTKGSGRSHIQQEVFRIMLLCKRLNIRIIPIHLLRDDPRIKIADDGSKTVDTDDWQVDAETFERSNRKYRFTIDLFASNRNSKCERFFSNFYCHGTSGIDAFCHSWDDEVAWICPPIRDVIRVIKRLKKSKTTGVLLVPEWKTADYWVEIFDCKGGLLWPFNQIETCKPFIIQNTYDYRSPFAGPLRFNFIAIGFDSH